MIVTLHFSSYHAWLIMNVSFTQMYGVVLMIIMTSTLGSALCGDSFAVSVTGSLILWRVILGIGIGGDYPMSAG